jgi:4-diphosphocytidyl-2-C-methyl-D-erythritol kinase
VSPRGLRVRAPAKINLSLAVRGRRADGFHELDTVLCALELADELTASAASGPGLSLAVRGPAAAGVPADSSNLVLRAAQALGALARARGLQPCGIEFALEKRVPAAAGLGGGSSDAAAAALACCTLWGLEPDDPDVLALLAELGSDCPFFLAARASGLARCTGRGERVEPLPALALPWTIAVVTPDFGCATADVYGALRGLPPIPGAPGFDVDTLRAGSLEALRAALRNDLQAAAERAQPALAEFRATLEALAPGAFRVAGSGSSCFAFFSDAGAAAGLIARLEDALRGRRYGLRARWIGPARSRGMEFLGRNTHSV